MGIISYVLRCSETEYSSYNQFWSSTASTTAILRSSGMTFEANKCKVQLKGQYGYHFLWSKVFWNRIFKLQSVSVFHGLYYSHFEVILDDLRGQKVQSWLKGQYGYHFLCSKVFWNRIFKLQPVLVIHGLYYSHWEVIWDDLLGQKVQSSTRRSIWLSISMF